MQNISKRFINSIFDIHLDENLHSNYNQTVYNCLIDYLAATVGGYKIACEKVQNIIDTFDEDGMFSIIGFDKSYSRNTALICNGIMSHVAELDDGIIAGILHPGAPIITAVLTVSQKEQLRWHDFVRGVLVGYEAASRLAEAIQPSHKKRGYHASATCGTVGVALAICSLLNFDKPTFFNAFSVSLASAHGTLKTLEDASELKPYNIATAAINGVISAYIAKAGLKGANDPLTGDAGFFSQMTDCYDESKLLRDDFSLNRVYFKPYASCRYTHPAIEAAIQIKNDYGINIEDIESVEIGTYSLAINHHDHKIVPNISSAKMCIPYGAAIGLVLGDGGISSFTNETINNSKIINLLKKVDVKEDTECTLAFPERSMAKMKVFLKNGKILSTIVDMPKGEPDNPLEYEDLLEKLQSSCSFTGIDSNEVLSVIQRARNGEIGICKIVPEINKVFNKIK